jgi:tetratricopeptide (TPR) repeat protein
MRTLTQCTATAVIIALAVLALKFVVWEPYRCNVIKKSLEQNTLKLFDYADQYVVAQKARYYLATLASCGDPTDIDLYMLRAANYRVLGRLTDAEATYQMALRYDQRPEIFFNLAQIQLALGKRDEAIENYSTAVRFNPYIIGDITDPAIWHEVHVRLWGS